MYKSFLIKYAEIAIKGKNRYLFEDALVQNIRYHLERVEGNFQVRKENIFAAAIGGGLGCLVNECGLALGLGTFFSIFLASLALASYSEIMARVRKTTVTTFLISGLFPLVPGAGMYYTMLAIVHNDLSEALSTGISTLSTAAVMALGILFVSTLSRGITYFRKTKSTGRWPVLF